MKDANKKSRRSRPESVSTMRKRLTRDRENYLRSISLMDAEDPATASRAFSTLYNILVIANTNPPESWVEMRNKNEFKFMYYRQIMPYLKGVVKVAERYFAKFPVSDPEHKRFAEGLASQKIHLSIDRINMVFELMNEDFSRWLIMGSAELLTQVLQDMNNDFLQSVIYHKHSTADYLNLLGKITSELQRWNNIDEINLNALIDIFETWLSYVVPEVRVEDDQAMASCLEKVVQYYQRRGSVLPARVSRIMSGLLAGIHQQENEAAKALMGLLSQGAAEEAENVVSTASGETPLSSAGECHSENLYRIRDDKKRSTIKALLLSFEKGLATLRTEYIKETKSYSSDVTADISPHVVKLLRIAKNMGMEVGLLTTRDERIDQGYGVDVLCDGKVEKCSYQGENTIQKALALAKAQDLFKPIDIVYCNQVSHTVLGDQTKLYRYPFLVVSSPKKDVGFTDYLVRHPQLRVNQVAVFDGDRRSILTLPTPHKFMDIVNSSVFKPYDRLFDELFRVLVQVVLYSNEYGMDKRVDAARALLSLKHYFSDNTNSIYCEDLESLMRLYHDTLNVKRAVVDAAVSSPKRLKLSQPNTFFYYHTSEAVSELPPVALLKK